MITHKIVETPEAAVYTPFALSKLRWMANNIKYTAVQTFIVGDVTIRLEHNPSCGYQIARLSGGVGVKYEFFTSDARHYPFDAKYCYGHATNVRIGQTTLSAKMAASWDELNGAPLYNPPTHISAEAVARWVGADAYNDQKVAFVQNYTTTLSADGKISLHYTTVPTTGRYILPSYPNNSGAMFEFLPSNEDSEDYGWDVRNPVFREGKLFSELQPQLPAPYWWRRGTVILAKDADGATHPITVVTDAMSNFHFFRTTLADKYTVGHQLYNGRLVPASCRVTVSASSFLPSWVEIPTINTMGPPISFLPDSPLTSIIFPTTPQFAHSPDTSLPGEDVWKGSANTDDILQRNSYLWVFNSDGSAASAIVHSNKGAVKYNPGGGANMFADNPANVEAKVMRWGYPNVWIRHDTEAADAAFFAAHGGLETLQVRVRGLLSVSIAVSITGTGPTDFTVSITPTLELQDRWYMDVAYAMHQPKLVAKGVHRDELLTTELELFTAFAPYGISGRPTASKFNCVPVATVRNTTLGADSAPLLRWGLSRGVGGSSDFLVGVTVGTSDMNGITTYQGVLVVTEFEALPQSCYMRRFSASDLKALAFVTVDDAFGPAVTETSGLRLFMFGEEVSSAGSPPPAEQYGAPNLAATPMEEPSYPMPGDLSPAEQYGAPNLAASPVKVAVFPSTDTVLGGYPAYAAYSELGRLMTGEVDLSVLNVHPDGHYSVYVHSVAIPDVVLDEIAYCTTKADGSVAYRRTTHRAMFNAAFKQSRTYADYQYGAVYGVGGFATAGMWL